MDTFISFVRFFLWALKRLAQAVFIVFLLLVLFRILESQTNPDITLFTSKIAAFFTWMGSVLWDVMCYFLDPWHAILLLVLAWPLYHYAHTFNDDVSSKVGALKTAAFDLVRLMETTTDGNDAKGKKLEDIVHRFAIEGAENIATAFGGPANMGDKPEGDGNSGIQIGGSAAVKPFSQVLVPTDLTDVGYRLMERRLGDMSSLGGNMGALRTGLTVFLLLMEHGNISGAFAHLTEHMKKQRDDAKKGLQNFIDLKRFFGLPTTWPKDSEPEEAFAKGLSWYQYLVFEAALSDKNKEKIYAMMQYHPMTPEGKTPITISGAKCLKSMRMYLYNWKNYDQALADPAE